MCVESPQLDQPDKGLMAATMLFILYMDIGMSYIVGKLRKRVDSLFYLFSTQGRQVMMKIKMKYVPCIWTTCPQG